MRALLLILLAGCSGASSSGEQKKVQVENVPVVQSEPQGGVAAAFVEHMTKVAENQKKDADGKILPDPK